MPSVRCDCSIGRAAFQLFLSLRVRISTVRRRSGEGRSERRECAIGGHSAPAYRTGQSEAKRTFLFGRATEGTRQHRAFAGLWNRAKFQPGEPTNPKVGQFVVAGGLSRRAMWSAAMDAGVWLRSLGRGQYEERCRDNKIDADLRPQLTWTTSKTSGSLRLAIGGDCLTLSPSWLARRLRRVLLHRRLRRRRARLKARTPASASDEGVGTAPHRDAQSTAAAGR